MWTSYDRAGVARGERLGRPRFIIRREDLKPGAGVCPACGGPKTLLIPQIPPGQEGDSGQAPPSYEEIGGYTRHIRPMADRVPCGWCELAGVIGGLFPRPAPHPFEDPATAELRRLRAELAPPAPPASSWSAPGDAQFDPGRLFISDGAAVTLETLVGRGLIRQGYDAPSVAMLGRPLAGPLLGRHVRGDHGLHGLLADGAADQAERSGPVAPHIDRNAHAVRTGKGTVLSAYRVERTETPSWSSAPIVVERAVVVVRTELDPDRGNLTLVALPQEISE